MTAAFLPPFDRCKTVRDVVLQLGFEFNSGHLSPKNEALVDHAQNCIDELLRQPAPALAATAPKMRRAKPSPEGAAGAVPLRDTPSAELRRSPPAVSRPRLWLQQLAEATTDAGSWEREFDKVVLGMSGRLVSDEADRLGFLCRRAVHLMKHKGGSDA